MNVTNRRSSTDADTPPSIQTQNHQPQLIAYITCRQAASASNRSNRSRQEEDQEPLVTSTSADSVLPLQAEGEGEEVSIDLETADTSIEHITSSTHCYEFVNESLDEMVMPSTSQSTSLGSEGSSVNSINTGISSSNRSTRSFPIDMVARDVNSKTLNDTSARGTNRITSESTVRLRDIDDQSTSSANNITVDSMPHIDKNKIILKLPKMTGNESQMFSSTEDDLRKVEPLKINLHNTHHHHYSSNTHHTPKITIKPILKENAAEALVSSEDCSSSAEEEMVSRLNNTEPHILPKLTIRAKNEDYGSSQTSVVPKLTIKINDSNSAESLTTATAAHTPPLPKLTIKTGQDGHPESIISNVSPASSTTSSSSSMASSSTSSSSGNFLLATPSIPIPKLTIKPVQKEDSKSAEVSDSHPSIPKLCIKTNTLCTDSTEEPILSKIPKLTIKTGHEHAVIITQHNDGAKAKGIPKMTIKTKSLDTADDSSISASSVVEKIPKFTIKTTTGNDLSKLCRNKSQSEVDNVSGTPLTSPNQSISKITINRNAIQMENMLGIQGNVETHCSSKTLTKEQCKIDSVPKVAAKSTTNRSSQIEDICISSDFDDECEDQNAGNSKIVPKLTIKNVGSPQQKLKFVVDTDIKSNKNTITLPVVDVADEFDLLNVDNVGGESSNSQEFCGFNDNADCTQNKEIGLDADANTKPELPRRHSDDMDIDETLRDQHEPKMFQNATNIHAQDSSNFITNEEMDLNGKASLKIGHIIDTVDLTSSAGSSPVHRFDYNDGEGEDNDVREKSPMVTNTIVPSTNILLECLQRETTVIQNTQQLTQQTQHNTALPPLQPKPMVATKSSVSLKYPQLAERLLANGSSVGCMDVGPSSAKKDSVENIIDSIEILDTPEGSPRGFIDDRHENDTIFNENLQTLNGLNVSEENRLLSLNNNSLNLKRPVSQECHVSETICTAMSEKTIETPSKLRKIQNESEQLNTKNNALQQYLPTGYQNHQRLRKQKHEHLLPIPMDEVTDAIQTNSNDSLDLQINIDSNENSTPIVKKRGRPKKSEINLTSENAKEEHTINSDNRQDCKARRVQLLRKRLAIDMVDAEQPVALITDIATSGGPEDNKSEQNIIETPKRERNLRTPLRTSRRSNTPINFQSELKTSKSKPLSSLSLENKKTSNDTGSENELNHFHESNSSISSVSFHSSSTIQNITNIANSVSHSMTSQIDLTISSSSSNSNGSTTNTITTVEATSRNDGPVFVIPDCSVNGANIGSNSHNSMLPPTTILSSSDPLPDMIFKPNDFSSIIATQQLRVSNFSTVYKPGSVASQEEETADDVSGADNSEDDSASSSSMPAIPGRSRGRVRGSRGRSIGRGQRSHGISRDSLSVKSIAMNRPRCIGALKHTPDPERIKELFSPSPQVFEEDTRMSADLSQTSLQQQSPSYSSQPDFFTNEESQSSIISNTSIIDPNSTASAQNSASAKKTTKKKKMEVCVAEDTDFTVASIAEYDWPPPKGCCPSKNRDTFMIQEQVAMYLGIKSFKRKYPDLPRRQVDMEERNWLQEKGLVSEKMCDLGITAVWASDILDIMYTDFYEKYEEYKDFVRQKHLREIEAKQKSLGLNVAGRGLQARERAMLSTSKWNSYFNRTRKDERLSFLDLQTLVINKPCPSTAPLSTIPNRPVAEAVALAIKTERISQPPTLLKPRIWEPSRPRDIYYPLSLVPGQFCEKYHDYSSDELRCMPLNTVVDPIVQMWSCKDCGNNSSDTDSAIESIDNKTEIDKSLPGRRHKKRRLRRTRQPGNMSADEFKVPLLPGAPVISTSSTDSCSSSDTSSSETDTESSCSSSSSDESSNGEESLATCEVCLRPHNRNLNNVPELFIQCYTCRRRVHPSCIEMPHRMSLRVRNYNWQCADCKCCVKCKRRHDQNKMLFCEQCDRGFHIYCLGIKTVPDGRWSCNRCSICMRCGATTPEGLSHMHQLINTAQGEHVKQTKQKKAKWVNEYRLDHLTKIKEHCSMLCIPCGKMKNSKRAQNVAHNNATTKATSPCSLSESSSNSFINYPPPSAISSQKLLPSPNATSNGELMHSSTVKESSGHAAPSTSIPTEDSYFSDNKDSERYSPVPSSFTSSIIAASNTQMTTTHNATGGPPPVVA